MTQTYDREINQERLFTKCPSGNKVLISTSRSPTATSVITVPVTSGTQSPSSLSYRAVAGITVRRDRRMGHEGIRRTEGTDANQVEPFVFTNVPLRRDKRPSHTHGVSENPPPPYRKN
ncbi:hypothetical protein PQX77_015773 [Marasmius sp. AFHP31]|nr:hypothetical protein PQX77_015773 [Marasmius sp. AFHP31]